MLVLSRKQEEKIVVGDNITITVLKIRGNTVRLGIDAPREVSVVRGELRDKGKNGSSIPPLTVEFRSRGTTAKSDAPTLRVVADEQEVQPDVNEEPDAAIPTVDKDSKPVHRLRQLVNQLDDTDRRLS